MTVESKPKPDEKPPKSNSKGSNRVKIAAPYAYVEELVVSSPNERNWRGIFIALLVIVAVLGLIVFSIVLVSPPEEGPRSKGNKPSLEDIFIKLPPPARFNGTWLTESEFVYKDEHGGVTLYNADNLTTRIIMTNSTFRQYDAVDFRISSDLRFVLLICEVTKIYKFTTLAKYYIYEIQTRIRKPLSPKELDDRAPFLQYAAWSPDGTGVVFVHDNDIYYKPKVEKDLVCRITSTGKPSLVYNGVPDWLYENEILKTSHTVWFSPNSLYLLYITFNDTQVGEYKYPWYDSGNPKVTYPRIKSFRFPTVETPNPDVTVWMVNLTRPKYLFPVELKPTNSVEIGSYITSASFLGEQNVAIIWLNRHQNVSVILTCKPQNNYNCTDFHIEREHIGWSERIFHPVFSHNGNQALVRLPVKDGDNGHYMHACLLFNNNVIPLTHGAFELSRILAWDEPKNLIYALATNENAPGVRHLFKIGDTNSSQQWTCMTCQPRIDPNVTYVYFQDNMNETMINNSLLGNYACDFNNIIFSKNYKYYIQECLGPNIPVVFLVETATNTRLAVLDASVKLTRKVKNLSAPQIKTIQVEIEDGYRAQVRLYLPPILREYEEVTFPLILLVDASPSSQTVSQQWELSWPWYLASTRNYIAAKIDARGSGFQGVRMRREIQHKIGSVEVQDQLAVLTYLRDTFKFIDRTKICTVGKGYGGYVATMMLLEDFYQVINCSVSISPITNWRYHNSYFTEKYLGIPSRHLHDYENADLTMRAGNLNERRFLLIHGSADTSVTPQHALLFARALIEQEVLFQQLVYPDEGHEFSRKSLIHMYKEIDQFFNDSFGPIIDDWNDDSSFFIQ
ncbi:inactive dipeptidyl peptidase 10 isoform X2 [Tribolium castaneum]|uniref:inactive dipeptidyl peptidase 10 isoform X2 n=1 Tax=Tribolium castaneum TaxID=7070 RepID=UPI0000D569C9|nr:PREDICTED: inactive dipeptidyl peptidase 10 isoform X2 [Tribolium castaneum]|eukprot:XP_975282.1 PREDICTED: inactive dipeptidyl peptidase 10 isoform X2 [Tribolium castaneum]